MDPDLRERTRFGVGGLALRDLVFVMREDEVHATGVHREPVSEVVPAHGRALDVPPRPSAPPRAIPAPFVACRAFPKREIERVALRVVLLDAGAHFEFIDAAA